jgi:hypothetical protein
MIFNTLKIWVSNVVDEHFESVFIHQNFDETLKMLSFLYAS